MTNESDALKVKTKVMAVFLDDNSLKHAAEDLGPLQYCSTVSMAHFRSLFQRIFAEPVHCVSSGCQPCHRYTSIRLSSKNRAEEATA